LIYKEAELDIDPEAGGTDLCPFDCECCKSISSPVEGYRGIMLTRQASDRPFDSECERLFPAPPFKDGLAHTITSSMHGYDIDHHRCNSTNPFIPQTMPGSP